LRASEYIDYLRNAKKNLKKYTHLTIKKPCKAYRSKRIKHDKKDNRKKHERSLVRYGEVLLNLNKR
tara:strand:+ start:390 stop:587 length:198 start_codon:yes stop_codon:yes gene_type:complete